jgi:hypothetical protein
MNWRESITQQMGDHGETWADVESCTLTDEQLDADFNDSFGSAEGEAFTLWTKSRVYFPAVYDGSEWVTSVSRNPDGIPTAHVGGQ